MEIIYFKTIVHGISESDQYRLYFFSPQKIHDINLYNKNILFNNYYLIVTEASVQKSLPIRCHSLDHCRCCSTDH